MDKQPKAPSPEKPKDKAKETATEQIAFYKRIGFTPDDLKSKFTQEGGPKPGTPLKKLTDLIRSRVYDGRTQSLRDYRIYAAIDEAYNISQKQITPTIIGRILDPNRRLSLEQIQKELKDWGLSEDTLFTEVRDEKGVASKMLNRETFWKVFCPLVKSYVTIRQAKLFNDRDNSPYLSYEPARSIEGDDLLARIITQLVEKMVNQYGYRAVFRQALLQSLKYAIALVFPAEAWHTNAQVDDDGKEFNEKEGLRYNIPHPTRMAWDRTYRPSTFNTDTGCEWALYWRLIRYGDVLNNSCYWNTDKVTYGTNWFNPAYSGSYFTEIYPCTFAPPADTSTWGKENREISATRYNANSDHDKALFVTDLFCKLKPNQWGLGDYKHDVWFRFVVASDDSVIWAEPLPYTPVMFLGYDADENSTISPSMALEVIPWQDLVGNVLSQHMLTVRQNLMKVIPYDSDQLSKADIKEIECASKEAVSVCWFPYSARKARAGQVDPKSMFTPINLGYQDTTSLITTINTIFNIMERLLVMSASETGSTAAHVQTAEEIRVTTNNTSTRVQYTDSFVEDFFTAWKKQLFDASRAFMDDEFTVELSNLSDDGKKALTDLGFEVTEKGGRRSSITGKKAKLSLYSFIAAREGKNRTNNPAIAQVILQTVQAVAGNQLLAQKVPAEQLIAMMNRAAHLAGAPEDFKIEVNPDADQQAQMQALAEQVQQMAKQIQEGAVQQATDTIGKQVGPALQQVQQQTQEVAAQEQQAQQEVGQALQQQQAAIQQQQEQINQMAQAMQKLNAILQQAAQPPQPQEMMQAPMGGVPPGGM